MFTLSYARMHRVLLARIYGIYSSDDLAGLDAALIHFLSEEPQPEDIRAIYDFREMDALAIPFSKLEERASQPPIVRLHRVLIAPRHAGETFGQTLRQKQRLLFNAEVTIVHSFREALELLGLNKPHFEAVEPI
jgi:hypothetical protein